MRGTESPVSISVGDVSPRLLLPWQWMSFSHLLFSVMCSCWLPVLVSVVGLEDVTEVWSSTVGFTEGDKLLEVGLTVVEETGSVKEPQTLPT